MASSSGLLTSPVNLRPRRERLVLFTSPVAIPLALGMLSWIVWRGQLGFWMTVPAFVGVTWFCVFWGYVWLWQAFGLEQLSIDASGLLLRREILGWGTTRRFEAVNVEDVRVDPVTRSWVDYEWNLLPWRGGVIAFRYGLDTIRFGSSLGEEEAQALAARLRNGLAAASAAVSPKQAANHLRPGAPERPA